MMAGVTTRTIDLPTAGAGGQVVPATYCEPSDTGPRGPSGGTGPRGGVVALHDARGVTPYLRSVLERLADAGWAAVAPHLYHRDGVDEVDPADGWAAAMPALGRLTGAGIAEDVDASLAHFGAEGLLPARVGVLGFCMGGTVALASATRHALGAAVSFYGGAVSTPYWAGVPPLLELAGSLRAPWLGLYGESDQLITLEEIAALRAASASARAPAELISYPGAGHAFHSDDRPAIYRPEAAADAWSRALAWLDRYLPAA